MPACHSGHAAPLPSSLPLLLPPAFKAAQDDRRSEADAASGGMGQPTDSGSGWTGIRPPSAVPGRRATPPARAPAPPSPAGAARRHARPTQQRQHPQPVDPHAVPMTAAGDRFKDPHFPDRPHLPTVTTVPPPPSRSRTWPSRNSRTSHSSPPLRKRSPCRAIRRRPSGSRSSAQGSRDGASRS